MDLSALILPIVIPPTFAVIIQAIAWGKSVDGDIPRWKFGLGGLVVGGAWILSHVLIVGFPDIPPKTAEDWLVFSAGLGIFLGFIDALLRPKLIIRIILWLGISIGTLIAILQTMYKYNWDKNQSILWTTALAGAGLLLWLSTDKLSKRRNGASLPLSFCLWATGISILCLELEVAKYAQLAGGIAGAMGATWFVGLFRKDLSLAWGAFHNIILLAGGLLICAWFYTGEPTVISFLLVVSAPLFLWIAEIPIFRNQKPWLPMVVRIAVMAALMAGAILTVHGEPPEKKEMDSKDQDIYDIYG